MGFTGWEGVEGGAVLEVEGGKDDEGERAEAGKELGEAGRFEDGEL